MASVEELKRRMDRAAEIEDPLDRRLWVLAVITEFLKPSGVRPILVGGAAVEFYTAGGYFTVDVDVIADSSSLDQALSEFGFEKSGRHWFRKDLDLALEAPSSVLAEGSDRVLRLDMDDMNVYVIGVEDLIVDRLNAYVHWKSDEDGRWAMRLLMENRDQIDWDYLERRAADAGASSALSSMREGWTESSQ